MRRTIQCVLMVAAIVVCRVSLAHEGEDHGGNKDKHVMGTVASIAGSKLTVKGSDGKEVNVHVDDRTQYEKAGTTGTAADVKVGAKVVVHGEMMSDGTLHAAKVRLGKDGAPAKKEHADHPKK